MEVDVDRSSQGERDDEHRRGEIGSADQRVDAAFEVAIAAQYRRHHQVVVCDGCRDRVRRGPLFPIQVVHP